MVETGEQGGRTWFAVDAAAETLRMTTAGSWQPGTRLNLERALKVGDELGGHIVAGHADGIAELAAREDLTDMARLTLRAPRELMRFVAHQGLGRARRRLAHGQRSDRRRRSPFSSFRTRFRSPRSAPPSRATR